MSAALAHTIGLEPSNLVDMGWTTAPTVRNAARTGSILVVDSQPLYRAALCWTLTRMGLDEQVVEVGRLSDTISLLRTQPCRLVLLADNLPDSSAGDGLRTIRAQFTVDVAILSSDPCRLAAHRASAAGAAAYLAKTASLEHMTATLAGLINGSGGRAAVPAPVADNQQISESTLTPAQARVLALVEKGQLNKQIAHEMGITESTVKAHVSAIFRKLKVQNRVQAIIAAGQSARTSTDGATFA